MTKDPFARTDKPLYQVTLWPNRSLGRVGFRYTMLIVIIGMAIPMIPLLIAASSWALLPFGLVPIALLYFLFKRNYRDGRLTEELRIWPDLITVERREPNGALHQWHANPYWIRIKMHDEPIENYLTLEGNQRTIELGAFLSPEERVSLKSDIENVIRKLDLNA